MEAQMSNAYDMVVPTPKDSAIAQISGKVLAKYVAERQTPTLQISEKGNRSASIEVPASALRLFVDILAEMAEGNSVGLLPIHAEMTTQEAAELLNVSRPFLVQMLEDGKIPFRKVGSKRRILAKDVIAFKKKNEKQRLKALEKLADQAQDLDFGY